MSIQTDIYNVLASQSDLENLLAASTINPEKPAIYEDWAPEDTPMPYINLTFQTVEGNHWGKRDTKLFVDIFTDQDSTNAEIIKNNVISAIDRKKIDLSDGDKARVHSDGDRAITEAEPGVVHWEVEFSVYYWRKAWLNE